MATKQKRKAPTRPVSRYMLTDAEKDNYMRRMGDISYKRGYGMSPRMIDALIDRHKNGNANMRTVVEEQLDDINYHREAELLRNGKYKQAYKENLKYHKEYGTKPTSTYAARMATEGVSSKAKGLVGG